MKRIYFILLLLCTLVFPTQVSAQIYSTAEAALQSAKHKSRLTIFVEPTPITFRGGVLADDTGFISTGDNQTSTNGQNNEEEDGWGPGTPDLPLHLDWDALLFILLLTIPYLYRVDKRRISGQ